MHKPSTQIWNYPWQCLGLRTAGCKKTKYQWDYFESSIPHGEIELQNNIARRSTWRSCWSLCGSWCWGRTNRPPACGSTVRYRCGCRGRAWQWGAAGREPPWWRWSRPAGETDHAMSLDSKCGSDHTGSRIWPEEQRQPLSQRPKQRSTFFIEVLSLWHLQVETKLKVI